MIDLHQMVARNEMLARSSDELRQELDAIDEPEAAANVESWFRSIVVDFSPDEVATFLSFSTAKPKLSAVVQMDPDAQAISIVPYVEREGRLMTASTCAKEVYLPWVAGCTRDALREHVKRVLDEFAQQEERNANAFDYQ